MKIKNSVKTMSSQYPTGAYLPSVTIVWPRPSEETQKKICLHLCVNGNITVFSGKVNAKTSGTFTTKQYVLLSLKAHCGKLMFVHCKYVRLCI